jgi:hypothetical protein
MLTIEFIPFHCPPDRVPSGYRRKLDFRTFITEVVVTPKASSDTIDAVSQLVKDNGYAIPVRPSDLARFQDLLPWGD